MTTKPVVTFDCYRTLVDFDLNRATLPIIKDRLDLVGVDHEEFLDNLRVMRFQGVANPYQRYTDIVKQTLETCMLLHGVPFKDEDHEQLMEEAKKFAAFPEVPEALERLKAGGYEIAIITNSDNDLIPYHVANIGVEFDYVVTAEQAGAYKPREQAFEYLFSVLPQKMDQITHAAQGWEYDIMPTKKYGIRRVWINRYNRKGSDFYQPYDELPDLSGLPALLGV
ncbi:haloacid dehalogenase type II [Arthrobacter sp. ISL-28]|uniref:haloacid dehalogenase type II n=1 Tax=Arthrobacter sp. ISL-28 TaxID=2819108 RepID=UPI001BE5EB52|nr:haloacid dehalogenase type II [Arthrobacter sp. ISL-28]MBT2520795.1 haloacid dehalogenase type II [Arthrobacter sp. ISL-28]